MAEDLFNLDDRLLADYAQQDVFAFLKRVQALADAKDRLRLFDQFLLKLSSKSEAEQDNLIREAVEVFGVKERTIRNALRGMTVSVPDKQLVTNDVEAKWLPTINAAEQHLPTVTTEAWRAVVAANQPPTLFRYGGQPVRIEHHGAAPVLQPLTQDRLRYHAAASASWVTQSHGQIRQAKPPNDVIDNMLASPSLPLPSLTRIVQAPVFGPDGSLRTAAGYHENGGTYYAPTPGFVMPDVPEHPSAREVADAKVMLFDDLFFDFPFVGEPERAHAICLAMLPFVRDLIQGPTPLHLANKPMPGTGAGLLVEMALFAALGANVAMMTEAESDGEWRKRIMAKLADGAPVMVIDNVRARLDSAALAAALTSTEFEDRRLGKNDDVLRFPVRTVWVATGNNVRMSDEIAQRSIQHPDGHQDA